MVSVESWYAEPTGCVASCCVQSFLNSYSICGECSCVLGVIPVRSLTLAWLGGPALILTEAAISGGTATYPLDFSGCCRSRGVSVKVSVG